MLRLREHLGERADAADRFAASAEHSGSWAAGVLGLYGPEGTDVRAYGGLSPPEQREALAVALDRYAAEGTPYRGQYFRRFVEAASRERSSTNGGHDDRRPPGKGRGKAGGAGDDDGAFDHLGG